MSTSSLLISGNTGDWEVVIGLEIHAQVSSNAKLFSSSMTTFGGPPNQQVSFVDAAFPGMLPVLNQECVRQAVRTGLAIGCKINPYSVFSRKNYFYADLPQGYQISQFDKPIVGQGAVEIELETGNKTIRVERIHLEQDAGKSLHDQHPSKSFIDLNRSGIALMEIVSFPDMRSADEAVAYVRKVRSILRAVGSCSGIMAQGAMRADVNVSVRRLGEELGTRTELKNLNSVRFIHQAIGIESKRQVALLEQGETIRQETRLFDPDKAQTRTLRSKEDAHDYRYFPDPDLPPLELSKSFIEEMRQSLPELPDVKRNRFIKSFHLSSYDASILVAEKEIADFFESVSEKVNPKLAANWILTELFGRLKRLDKDITQSPVTASNLVGLLQLIEDKTISGKIAKDVFDNMFETGETAKAIVEKKGLQQITDLGAIETIVDDVISKNPSQVEAYRQGKEQLIGWFVGQVMKASRGKANPDAANKLLKDKLAQ